jgi:phenylacetate-coenzyme A ligase PaaK-like adenylate-forming protein
VNTDTIWDPQAERMTADERAALQARRLDDLLGRLAERSPIYRERLGAAGTASRPQG